MINCRLLTIKIHSQTNGEKQCWKVVKKEQNQMQYHGKSWKIALKFSIYPITGMKLGLTKRGGYHIMKKTVILQWTHKVKRRRYI